MNKDTTMEWQRSKVGHTPKIYLQKKRSKVTFLSHIYILIFTLLLQNSLQEEFFKNIISEKFHKILR